MSNQTKPMLSICPEFGSIHINQTLYIMNHEENGKVHVIENIPELDCERCEKITPEANGCIDKLLSVFRSYCSIL